jgi:hypothetical protein
MAHAKNELPGWFPYAITASFLVMIGAGIKSNWGKAKAPAPLQQGGVLQDWFGGDSPKRWFFWYILPSRATSYSARGPQYMTDQEAFQLEFATKTASLGTQLYRFVWIPAKGIWVYDTRNEPALLASREISEAA